MKIFLVLFLAIGSYMFAEDYEKLALKVVGQHLDYMRKKEGFVPKAIGGGMMDNIKLIGIDYSANRQVSVEEAKGIYCDAIKDLLYRINNAKFLIKYLNEYPFTYKSIDMSISFRDKFYNHFPYGYPSLVSIARDNLFIKTYNHEKEEYENLAVIPVTDLGFN